MPVDDKEMEREREGRKYRKGEKGADSVTRRQESRPGCERADVREEMEFDKIQRIRK